MNQIRFAFLALCPIAAVAAEPSPAQAQLAWVLASVAAPPADPAPRFTPAFLAAVPQVGAVFASLADQLGALTVVAVERESATELVVLTRSEKAGGIRIVLKVEPDGEHRIAGLLFQPADLAPAPTSWDDVAARVTAVAPNTTIYAAELTSGACAPIQARDADRALAIGSAFKLYVLDELAHQVAAGEHQWTEPLAIRDDWKSLPSGALRDAPAGQTLSLRDYAAQMISVSDNTAADHLLHTLGRERVEAAAARAGNPRNAPFLSTREMFVTKLVFDDAARARYVAAPEAGRRALLAEAAALPLSLDAAAAWTQPRAIGEIEWFATATELCQEALALRADGPEVRAILALNPGVPDTAHQWTWVGYKGGSEPGVLNLTWLLERADGRSFFLTVGFNDPANALDQTAGIAAAAAARGFLAGTP